jgi:hypothetical protein
MLIRKFGHLIIDGLHPSSMHAWTADKINVLCHQVTTFPMQFNFLGGTLSLSDVQNSYFHQYANPPSFSKLAIYLLVLYMFLLTYFVQATITVIYFLSALKWNKSYLSDHS